MKITQSLLYLVIAAVLVTLLFSFYQWKCNTSKQVKSGIDSTEYYEAKGKAEIRDSANRVLVDLNAQYLEDSKESKRKLDSAEIVINSLRSKFMVSQAQLIEVGNRMDLVQQLYKEAQYVSDTGGQLRDCSQLSDKYDTLKIKYNKSVEHDDSLKRALTLKNELTIWELNQSKMSYNKLSKANHFTDSLHRLEIADNALQFKRAKRGSWLKKVGLGAIIFEGLKIAFTKSL